MDTLFQAISSDFGGITTDVVTVMVFVLTTLLIIFAVYSIRDLLLSLKVEKNDDDEGLHK